MATDREIIKEFLVALGFKIEDVGLRKLTTTLTSITKMAGVTGTAIASVTAAAEVMVHRFASDFERLYYASQRTGQTVKNLRAIEFAAGQIGLTAEDVSLAVEGLAKKLRENPGLRGLLPRLGVNPESKNLLTDFVTQMTKISRLFGFNVAKSYGEMFGIDSDTLFMLMKFLPEFIAAQEKSKNLDMLAGFSDEKLQKLAEAGKEFNTTLREIWKTFSVIGEVLEAYLLPYFQSFNTVIKEVLKDTLAGDFTIVEDAFRKVGTAIGVTADNLERLLDMSDRLSAFITGPYDALSRGATGHNLFRSDAEKEADAFNEGKPRRRSSGRIGGLQPQSFVTPTAPPGSRNDQIAAYFSGLERTYGLPQGLLNKVWQKETAQGKVLSRSSAGAVGQFQFLPETGKRYGLEGDDFYSIKKSSEAAARYIADLVREHGGNLSMAMGNYHGESGFKSKYALGANPTGFSGYVKDTAGGTHVILNQKTDINVTGSNDPETTAKRIGAEQSRVNGDLVRAYSAVPR